MKPSFRVFVTDDNPDERFFIQRAFAQLGITDIETFRDGQELIDRLSSISQDVPEFAPPDAIVLDLEMPRATGLDVLAWTHAKGISFPIILHTASDEPFDEERALQLGAFAFIRKVAGHAPLVKALCSLRESGRKP
jgi:CheY-like chemotaxis protein